MVLRPNILSVKWSQGRFFILKLSQRGAPFLKSSITKQGGLRGVILPGKGKV